MNNSTQRDRQVRRIIIIEGLANLFVLAVKTVIGFSTGSMAILADAVHSLTDFMNNIIALTVMHFSTLPADREHPYGHRKFETLAVFILASILVILAFELILNTFRREQTEIVSSNIELILMLGVLVINVGVTSWQHIWAKRLNSEILYADASHTFADVLITSTTIGGWQLSAMGYIWADQLSAIGVALFVFYLAYKLFKRTTPILLDEYAIAPEELSKLIKNVQGVKNVYRVRSRWTGQTCAIDVVISVDSTLSIKDSHNITDKIEA